MGWNQVNPYAAGFQNCGVVAPWAGHDSIVLTGGDTAGIHKSTDKGSNFVNRDASIVNTDTKTASFAAHPTQAGRFFCLTGNGSLGSLFESTDYGDTWTDVSSGTPAVFGDGGLVGNSGSASLLGPGNAEHPRSVGRLLSVDATNGYIYIGTFNNGVYRGVLGATHGVSSLTLIGLTPGAGTTAYYIRGVLYDSVADRLYVSTYSDPHSSFDTQSGHIWRCSNPRAGSPTFSEFTNSPMCSSAMLVLNGVLFTVAHPTTANLTDAGLWYLNSAGSASLSASFTKIGAVPTSGSARWMSIDGYGSAGAETLWCGSAGQATQSVCKVVRSGGTWSGTIYPLSTGSVHNDVGGPNTPANPWWFYPTNKIGSGTWVSSTISINPNNTDEIYIFGRSGCWRSLDGGGNWYPIVKGIGATVTLTVLADPKTQGKVYIGLGDWSNLISSDSLATATKNAPGPGSFAYSTCLDEKTTPVGLIASSSARSDSNPTTVIKTNADVFGGAAWQDTGFSVAGICVCLTCVYSGTTRILIAGMDNGNLYRKVGTGAWTLVPNANMSPSGGINLAGTDTHVFAREVTGTELYLYDRSTGVWRSVDQGLHWVRIWNHASGANDLAGWLATDPLDPTKLYVSDLTSVYLITSANTVIQDAVALPSTHISTIGAALGARGPMTIDKVNRKIGVCDITATPKFWESPLSAISWVDKSDQLYQNAVASPQWLSYDRAGNPIIALSGNGVIMYTPGAGGTAPFFTAAPVVTGTAQEGSILSCDGGAVSGTGTITKTYQWQFSTDSGVTWTNIGGATSATYTIPTSTYTGDLLQCVVTATSAVSPAAVADSNDVGPVVASSANALFTVLPVITGTLQEGHTLTCSTGAFTGTPTPTETYQWETSPSGNPGSWTAIGGATSNTYSLPTGSAGSWIRCHCHIANAIPSFDDAWALKQGPILATTATNPGPATVAIVFPPDGSTVNSAQQVIQVSAMHPYGIASVDISLNGGGYQSATLNPDTGYWELSVSLLLHINTISARATDAF